MTGEPTTSERAQTLLDLLAVAGHPVPALVLSQLPELGPDPARVLDDAERQGLVAVVDGWVAPSDRPDGPGGGSVVDHRPEPGLLRRAQLRAVLGHALTGVRAVPDHVVAAHRLAGLLAQPDPEAVPDALAVADRILRTGDLDEAIGLFRLILDSLDHGAEPASARVSALGGLASALSWAGRSDEGHALLAAATATAQSSGDGYQLAAAAMLWESRAIAIDDDPANVSLIDRALEALGHGAAKPGSPASGNGSSGSGREAADGDGPADRRRAIVIAQLLGLRASRLVFAELETARRLSAEALDRARRTAHAATIVSNAYCRRLAIWHPATHDEVMDLANEMVRLSTATSVHPEFGAVTRLQVFFEQGDFAHFDSELRTLDRRVAYQRGRFERVWLDTFQAARALVRGDWVATARHIGDARALTAGFDYDVLDQLLLAQEMLMSWHQGADLSTLVTGGALPAGPMREAWMACLLGLSADRLDQSVLEAGLLRHLGDGISQVRDDLTWAPVTACLSLAAVAARSTTHALILTEALAPYASQWAATGGAVSFGPLAWHLGGLAHVLGRRDEARHHLEHALARCREAQAEPWAARVHLSLGALDGPDRAEHLHEASLIADRLGLTPVARAARQLGPAGARPSRPGGLTEREVDVLALLADGLTNREIAGQLYLSVKTVERHLLNAYAKIGVKNRSEATAFALRHDLTDR